VVRERRRSARELLDEVCRAILVLTARRRGRGPHWIVLRDIELHLAACGDDVTWSVLRGAEEGRLSFAGVPAQAVCLNEGWRFRTPRPRHQRKPCPSSGASRRSSLVKLPAKRAGMAA